jgi:hypothetical protein
MAYALKHQGQITTASGLDVLAGIWLLISPFVLVFQHNAGAITNNVVLGIVIGVLALYRFFAPARDAWVSWVNVLLGIWVLISPFVVGFNNMSTATTNNVIMGIIVIILAGWSALATTDTATRTDQMNP